MQIKAGALKFCTGLLDFHSGPKILHQMKKITLGSLDIHDVLNLELSITTMQGFKNCSCSRGKTIEGECFKERDKKIISRDVGK